MIIPKNLLIVRTDRIGDVVLSLPLAELIKRKYPNCQVTFLLRNYTKSIAENHPFIDEIIILDEDDKKIPIKKNVDRIKSKNFDSAILVYPTFQTALIIFLSGIKNRVGSGYRWYSLFFNHKIYEHRKYAEKHELEYNVNLLKKFGIEENTSKKDINFYLKPDENSLKKVYAILAEFNFDSNKPTIIIHPGSGGSAIDLPKNKFLQLVETIGNQLDANLLITGTQSEYELCSSLAVNNKIKNLAGKFNLSEMIAVISFSDIFISNSTGPIHIAAALEKYTLGFYPKITACLPRRWGPYSEKSVIFMPKIDCNNCNREQCERIDCMSSIEVPEVFAEVLKFYKIIQNSGEKNV